MKRQLFIIFLAIVLIFARAAWAQDVMKDSMLSTAPTAPSNESPRVVTAVYGISADDYMPTTESRRNQYKPKIRRSKSRPSFNLPDAFYFIGGPIFILSFLSVLVIFINDFEEKRKAEMRAAARETMDPE